jgi:hypothetical protein
LTHPNLKQHGQNWRIELNGEEWEFRSRADMEKALKTLLDMKENKGQLKDNGRLIK